MFQDIARDMNDSWGKVCRSVEPPCSIRLLGDCRQVMPARYSLINVLSDHVV